MSTSAADCVAAQSQQQSICNPVKDDLYEYGINTEDHEIIILFK